MTSWYTYRGDKCLFNTRIGETGTTWCTCKRNKGGASWYGAFLIDLLCSYNKNKSTYNSGIDPERKFTISRKSGINLYHVQLALKFEVFTTPVRLHK